MTRLMNVEKAGYFPLPTELIPVIASYIVAPDGGRILDPCAGKGEALNELAQALEMEPYAVELNADRATQAKTVIDHVIQDDYRNLRCPTESFNLLYENPPYLFVEDKLDGRAEYQWLRDTRPHLQTGGLLVWVVPQHMLRHRLANRYLATWFDAIRVYRFPGDLYDRFHQVVVFGIRKAKSAIPDPDRCEALRQMGKDDAAIPELIPAEAPLYILPKLLNSKNEFYFRGLFIDPAEAKKEALSAGIITTDDYHRHLSPNQKTTELSPLTPLKIGHMNSIIAAGHLNNHLLQQDDETLLIKGHSYKRSVMAESEEELADGKTKLTQTVTENIVTQITTLAPDGEIQAHDGPGLETFLSKWLPQLTENVIENFPPRYQFNLNGYGPTLASLNQKRLIPRVGKPGLIPAQAHSAAAVATQLETKNNALIVGEMGTGKTLMGTAVAACITAKHTIILCPPHLVDKWIREVKITWPQAHAMAITAISEVDLFFNHPGPIIGVMKETAARSASGWSHSYDWFGPTSQPTRKQHTAWNLECTSSKKSPKTMEELQSLIQNKSAITRYIRVRCPDCGAITTNGEFPLSPNNFTGKRLSCTHCGAPLYQDERRRTDSQKPGSFKLYAKRERSARDMLQRGMQPIESKITPNDRHGYARYPLATYIHRHYKRRLDLLIADECHQYKASDSDRGYAFHRLACAARKVVGMTGTIYGGKASTLFHLLYRIAGDIKNEYSHNSARKWVEHYGILQEVTTSFQDEDGKLTGNSRNRTNIKELPGGSPAMLSWLLNRSVFVSLADMGFALPDYEEIPVSVTMTAAQEAMYESLKEQLMAELRERLVRNDRSLLAGYLQALLSWPDSPWRKKIVRDPKTEEIIAQIPGLDAEQLYPKEERIIEIIKEELKQNRKVLLLCQQTATLDITPQWQTMLNNHNISSAVLKAPPNKREAWIKKQISNGTQVIISHPKRVETGLDLLDFPTIIWMGTEYSVYTIMQASRRSWRIGQDQPVKVFFFCYENTLQEDALHLVAAKVAATLRINGDTIPDDSLAELDELANTDIVTALARIVTGQEERPSHSLQQAFQIAAADFHSSQDTIGAYEMIDLPEQAPLATTDDAAPPLMTVMPIKIKSTNLSFTNLSSWCDAFEKIKGRKDSSGKYMQIRYALETLPIWMCENETDKACLKRALQLLKRAQPPKGMRKNHVTRSLIVALENCLAHGPKVERKKQKIKPPMSTETAETTETAVQKRLQFGITQPRRNKRRRGQAPPPPSNFAGLQLSLFS